MALSPRITKEQVRIVCALITSVGALYTWQALRLPMGDPVGSGEGGIPFAAGVLWVVFGLLVTIRAPSPKEASGDEAGRWPDLISFKRLAAALVLCIGFLALLNFLGTLVTSAAFMALMARLCGASWSKSVVAGLVMSICLWLLFVRFLQLSLPAGVLSSFLPGA